MINDINKSIDFLKKDIKIKLSQINLNTNVKGTINTSIKNVVKHGIDFDMSIKRLANLIVDQVNNSGDFTINNTSNIIEENNEALISTDKNDSLFSNLKDSIPKYYLDGLYFSESNNNNSNKTLNEIWEDFLIYDSIIDYYYSNIWGIENICKKVKIEYNGNERYFEIIIFIRRKYFRYS